MNTQSKSQLPKEADTAQAVTADVRVSVANDSLHNPPRYRVSILKTFVLAVMLPATLAAVYYGWLASDQFVAETRMIVRTIGISERFDESEERQGRAIVGGDSLTQDAYIVANFIESAELVKRLDERVGLRAKFNSKNIDYISRLSEDTTFEDLHGYWLSQIDTYVDGPSGIIVLRLRAFSPEDAIEISTAVLTEASAMIERISDRAKDDLVARAEKEVRQSAEAYGQALTDLRDFQNRVGILDPKISVEITSGVISQLIERKLNAEVRLSALVSAGAENSPRAERLRELIAGLEVQIAEQEETVTSEDEPSDQLSQRMAEFARFETRRLVAEAIYESSQRNLDTAKSTALRRSTFISVFSSAYPPEQSRHPARFSTWLLVTAGLLCLWTTLILIWKSVEDHTD